MNTNTQTLIALTTDILIRINTTLIIMIVSSIVIKAIIKSLATIISKLYLNQTKKNNLWSNFLTKSSLYKYYIMNFFYYIIFKNERKTCMNMNSIIKKLNRYSNEELKELIKKLNLSQRNNLYNALIFNYALTDIKRTIDNDPEFYNDFTQDDIILSTYKK